MKRVEPGHFRIEITRRSNHVEQPLAKLARAFAGEFESATPKRAGQRFDPGEVPEGLWSGRVIMAINDFDREERMLRDRAARSRPHSPYEIYKPPPLQRRGVTQEDVDVVTEFLLKCVFVIVGAAVVLVPSFVGLHFIFKYC